MCAAARTHERPPHIPIPHQHPPDKSPCLRSSCPDTRGHNSATVSSRTTKDPRDPSKSIRFPTTHRSGWPIAFEQPNIPSSPTLRHLHPHERTIPPSASPSAPTHPPTPVNCPGTRILTREPAPLLVERVFLRRLVQCPFPVPIALHLSPLIAHPPSSLPDRKSQPLPPCIPSPKAPPALNHTSTQSRCSP